MEKTSPRKETAETYRQHNLFVLISDERDNNFSKTPLKTGLKYDTLEHIVTRIV
jgi:hypothetical protein